MCERAIFWHVETRIKTNGAVRAAAAVFRRKSFKKCISGAIFVSNRESLCLWMCSEWRKSGGLCFYREKRWIFRGILRWFCVTDLTLLRMKSKWIHYLRSGHRWKLRPAGTRPSIWCGVIARSVTFPDRNQNKPERRARKIVLFECDWKLRKKCIPGSLCVGNLVYLCLFTISEWTENGSCSFAYKK